MADNLAEDRERWMLEARTALERDPRAAEALTARLVRDHPSDPRRIALWARALAGAGQTERAIRLLTVSRADQHPALSLVLARLQRSLGRLESARDAFRFGLRHHPEQTACWLELSEVLTGLGDGTGAAEACANAIRSNPASAQGYLALGAILQAARGWDRAETVYREGLKVLPQSVALRCDLGAALLARGEPRSAIGELEPALSLAPGHGPVRYNLGSALMEIGDFEGARGHFEALLDRHPEHADAWFKWVHCGRKNAAHQDRLQVLQAIVHRTEADASDRARLHFALGKFLDDLDRYEEAADAFHQANALRRAERRYDRGRDAKRVDCITQSHCADATTRRFPSMDPRRRLLFIVGMPRSGSTLVEQVLGGHSQVVGLGETDRLERARGVLVKGPGQEPRYDDPARLERAARAYLDGLPEGPALITDKTLSNVFRVGLIKQLFPAARILHVQRNRAATGWSIYRSDFSDGHDYAFDLDHIAHRAHQVDRLMSHWHRRYPDDLLDLHYEDLVDDFEPTLRALLAELELDWEEGIDRFHRRGNAVSTASQWQVRQPIYRSALQRWQHYRGHLGPLLADEDSEG